jgi:hypothetical protein
MDKTRRYTVTILIITLLVGVLMACESVTPNGQGQLLTYQSSTPSPLPIYNQGAPQAAYADAQATLDYGQGQLMELSHQATVVSLNMAQAADAAAQSTQDSNQSQVMELSYQATVVSLNMAQAADLQRFFLQQTRTVRNATATAQANAVTAQASTARAEYYAQVILNSKATETAQAKATQTAYSLTATPLAAIQAANVFQQRQNEKQSLWRGIVTPLEIILITLIVLLLIAGCVLAYRRFMPVLELRLLIPRSNNPSLILIDGTRVDADADPRYRRLTPWELSRANLPQFSNGEPVQVEIIDPSEPLVAHWISEAEQELLTNGGI